MLIRWLEYYDGKYKAYFPGIYFCEIERLVIHYLGAKN